MRGCHNAASSVDYARVRGSALSLDRYRGGGAVGIGVDHQPPRHTPAAVALVAQYIVPGMALRTSNSHMLMDMTTEQLYRDREHEYPVV
jgi:hypothetical protein